MKLPEVETKAGDGGLSKPEVSRGAIPAENDASVVVKKEIEKTVRSIAIALGHLQQR